MLGDTIGSSELDVGIGEIVGNPVDVILGVAGGNDQRFRKWKMRNANGNGNGNGIGIDIRLSYEEMTVSKV